MKSKRRKDKPADSSPLIPLSEALMDRSRARKHTTKRAILSPFLVITTQWQAEDVKPRGGASANQSYYIQRYSAIQSYPHLQPWSREKGEINCYELYMRMLFSLLADIILLVPTFR